MFIIIIIIDQGKRLQGGVCLLLLAQSNMNTKLSKLNVVQQHSMLIVDDETKAILHAHYSNL